MVFVGILFVASCQIFDPMLDDLDFNDSELSNAAKIKQSEECSPEEIEKNIQCFQEIPRESYEVALGSAITLRCIVRNQHGKVQWRAVPVLLGYDRNIPGRPRYRVIGEVVRGEHFLEIQDVHRKDAGVYECQVQPVGATHPLLRRKTTLTVLVKPDPPHILYHDVRPYNNNVIINSIKQEVRSSFTCVSHNGQPKVTFEWTLNNRSIMNTGSVLIESVNEYRSKMSLLTSTLKNGDVIKCRVSNRAIEKHHDKALGNLFETEIIIIEHNPPGQPEITEINPPQSGAYMEGDVIKASCESTPPGKPAGTMLWRWKFPDPRRLFNNEVENFTVKHISPNYYQHSLIRNHLISKLELPPLTSYFHGAQLFCVASNPVTSYQSVAKKISIKYPPSEVVISVSDGTLVTRTIGTDGLTENVIFGEAGEEKTLTCTTAAYYNEAMLKWQFHHNPSSDGLLPRQVSFIPLEKVWKEGESFRRNSTIKVTIDKQFDKSYLDCQAWSGGKRVDARVKLDITYPPEKPIISGYHGSTVKVNKLLILTCSTVGGNPYPELQWFRDDKPIESSYSAQQIGTQRTLKIKILPTMADNNVKYFCQAKSVTLKNSPLTSDGITLNVSFPPTTGGLKSLSGHEIDNGHIVTLQCTAGESNPRATVRWKINRCGQMMSELGRRPTQISCAEETLTNFSTETIIGKFGGELVTSNLELRTYWRDHLDYVDCEIFNNVYGEEFSLRKRIQLNVTFVPQFEGIVNKYFTVEEDQSYTVDLEPIANPPVQRYSWLKGLTPLEPNQKTRSITIDKAKLIITHANSADMGNYTLVANNDKGESRITVFLNVTYRPIIIGDMYETVTNNRQNADLECSVRSNPANPHASYKWVKLVPPKGMNDISNSDLVPAFSIGCNQAEWKGTPEKSNFKYFSKCSIKSQFEMSSELIVYDVDRNDVGLYKCIVNNGIGADVVKTIELIKHFTPQILEIPKFSKAAGNQGSSVTLSCYIRAEPQPTMTWFFGRFNSSISANSKYRMDITRKRVGFYLAQLTITNLQRSDHGQFFCKTENLKGSDSKKIDVSGTSSPDVPLDLQIVNKSINTIEISWVQGFDGGSLQTFQVRWKEKSASSLYRYEDIASDDSRTALSFLITGLKSDTIYHISINSRNAIHGNSAFSKTLVTSTLSAITEGDSNHVTFPITSPNKLQDNTILFIVAASVFGFVLLVVNILVIIFVLRRRRQRSRTAKLEARYNNPKSLLAASNGLILSRDDSMKDSNFNYLRSDMVELYPRGLDSSQILHHNSHQLHSLRRSIPDDQKTFSSFETGSDDAREDLIRRQKDFGCCNIDPNNQKGPFIVAYDPITNASYYAPVPATSPTPFYIQQGMYDQDTMSTLLSPIHEGSQRQLMTFMNMIPVNGQRNSSSCGSVHSGGNYSNNRQPIVANNISPNGSISATDSNNIDGSNVSSGQINGIMDPGQTNAILLNSFSNNTINTTPYRPRVVSPHLMAYTTAPQHRDTYANELRKAQLAGNIMINPAVLTRHSATSPQHIMGSPPLLSPHAGQTATMSLSFENLPVNSNIITNAQNSTRLNDPPMSSFLVSTTIDSKASQKYRCVDNELANHSQKSERSIEFINSAMEDSTHQSNHSDSHYLPRPNMI